MNEPTHERRVSDTNGDHADVGHTDTLRDARGVLAQALATMAEQIALTGDDAWTRPSPCEGWQARDVVLHVVGTLTKTAGTLGGAAYAGQPQDPALAAAADPRAAWASIAAEVERLLPQADPQALVSTPRGPMPVSSAIALPAADLAVHAWDLAAAGGREIDLPANLIDHVRAVTATIPPQALRAPGLFGPERPAAETASPTEALMAWLGRSRPA